MESTTRSKVPYVFLDQSNREPDVSGLANRILQYIEEQVPLEAALLVLGNPPHVANPHGLSISDSTMMYVFPLVHAGILESILYLRHPKNNGDEPQLHHLNSLNLICEDAARAFAQSRRGEIPGIPASLPAELPAKSKETEGLRIPLSLMSSRLLGMIAHDLRTPVTVIRGYLKLMLGERTGALTQDQRECLEGAMNSMYLLSTFAEQIGKASGLIEQIHPEVLNVQNDLWRKNWMEVRLLAAEKAVSLREQLPAEDLKVLGDRRMLCDVIKKVLVGSIALADRNSELFVEVFSRRTGDIVLKIAFTGRSMEPMDEDVVSGLQSTVFLNGGKLTFSPTCESGSSFTLSLPEKDA